MSATDPPDGARVRAPGAPGSALTEDRPASEGRRGDLAARLAGGAARLLERDLLVLGVLLIFAAAVRFAGLAGRGDFDGDQGHDMLTLLRFVRDGQVPLLGPPTSIGDFHHGAAYYFLLAPVAWLSGADPVAVLAAIAALGTAAVGVTWWVARAMGGRVAGLTAGLLLAVSPAAIEESTFLWNPNPVPFFAAVALAAAWRGRQTGRGRWWALAVASAGMVFQLHVLGAIFLPPVLAFGAAEVVRARRAGDRTRARGILAGVGAGLVVVALLFVPLLIHELQTGFQETRNAIAYFTGPSAGTSTIDPVGRLLFTTLRVIGWPLTGLVTVVPVVSIVVVSITLVLGTWLLVSRRGDDGAAARWLGLTIAWSALALTVLAPSLQTVVAGLPNDHYHAFLDPVVVVLAALGLQALGSGAGLSASAGRVARSTVVLAVVALVAFDAAHWPPLTQANGGWPLARDAGRRIVADAPGASFDVRGLPVFKTAEGIGFPIIAAGGSAVIATDATEEARPVANGSLLVISCDRLFESVIGSACGGSAEAQFLATIPGVGSGPDAPVLVDRFDASPRTSVSVYRP